MRFYFRPVILALLATAFAGMPVYAASVSQARSLLDQGLHEKALEQANAVLSSDSGNAEARFVQAVAKARLGQAGEAIETLADLAKRYPDSPEPANNLAVLYAKQGDYEKARRWLESAMGTHPAYATAHRNLGDVYTALAAVAYSRALDQKQSSDLGVDLEMVNSFLVGSGKNPTALAQAAQSQPAAPAQPRPVQPTAVQGPYKLPGTSQPLPQQTKPPVQAAASAPAAKPEPLRPPARPKPAPTPTVATAPVAPQQPAVAAKPEPAARQPVTQPPATAPVSPATAAANPNEAILAMVQGWAAAWSTQNVDGYLNSYAENFYPGDNLTLPQWRDQRRKRVGKPGDIEVRVINPEISLQGQDRASVSFRQAYESANYSDQVRKTLELQRKAGGWKIVREVSQPL